MDQITNNIQYTLFMEVLKHSAGPWSQGHPYSIGPMNYIDVFCNDLRLIASVSGKYAKASINAKLIAAAPEMIDALQAALELLNYAHPIVIGETTTRDNDFETVIDQIQTAIEKATK